MSFLAAGDNRKLRTCAATRPLSIVGFLLSPPAPSVFRPARLASEYTRAYWKWKILNMRYLFYIPHLANGGLRNIFFLATVTKQNFILTFLS